MKNVQNNPGYTIQYNYFLKKVLRGEREVRPRNILITDMRVVKALYLISFKTKEKIDALVTDLLREALENHKDKIVAKFVKDPETDFILSEQIHLAKATKSIGYDKGKGKRLLEN